MPYWRSVKFRLNQSAISSLSFQQAGTQQEETPNPYRPLPDGRFYQKMAMIFVPFPRFVLPTYCPFFAELNKPSMKHSEILIFPIF